MKFSYLVIFFLFGLLFGDIFTKIGLRLPVHKKLFNIKDKCRKCSHELKLRDRIPFISYFLNKGKCRYCNCIINDIPVYMEFFCGILFALSYFAFGFTSNLIIALGIVSMLIIISVSDMTYFIIPDEVLIFFTGYFIICRFLSSGLIETLKSIGSGALLFGLMYFVMWIGSILFKKECLGGGDVKMLFVFGLVLHPFLGLFVIFIASVLALPVSLFFLYGKQQKMVPFGPFLLISFAFVFFTKIDVKMIFDFLELI